VNWSAVIAQLTVQSPMGWVGWEMSLRTVTRAADWERLNGQCVINGDDDHVVVKCVTIEGGELDYHIRVSNTQYLRTRIKEV